MCLGGHGHTIKDHCTVTSYILLSSRYLASRHTDKQKNKQVWKKVLFGMWMLQACSMRKCHIFAYARSISLFTVYMFLNCWNTIKIISNIWYHFPCLIDEGIAKTCKKYNSYLKTALKITSIWAWWAIISCR